MAIEKEILRKKLLANRPQASSGITEQLIALVKNVKPITVGSYQPQPNEPDVSDFNQLAANLCSVVFPRVVGEQLEFAGGDLLPGSFGILEPIGKAVTEIDLLIVPCLAVDRSGNRLGKGRGFYDRLLENFSGPCYGVVFDSEVLAEVPTDPHDQKLSGFVTPTLTVHF